MQFLSAICEEQLIIGFLNDLKLVSTGTIDEEHILCVWNLVRSAMHAQHN